MISAMAEQGTAADDRAIPEGQAVPEDNVLAFEAFGVRAALSTNRPELVERLRPLLPPGWQPCPVSTVGRRFSLIAKENGTYDFGLNGEVLNRGLELELALMLLDAQLRLHIGVKAPDMIFIHAGVVAYRGRTVVMPGKSFAGKTVLVAALVDRGATYYSDEFAVIDMRGLIHPYAKALSLRGLSHPYAKALSLPEGRKDLIQTDHSMESLGWTAGSETLPIGAIVVTTYRRGAEWRPRRLSSGEGAMALLANAVPARDRPAQVMRALSHAAGEAITIESERGEADEVAPLLLAELERQTA
jgi:hypothetical protein